MSTTARSSLALLLLVLISTGCSSVEARATDDVMMCDKKLMACLNEQVVRFDDTKGAAETCRILQDFENCVSDIGCLSQEAREELITNMTAAFKKVYVDCDRAGEASIPDIPVEGSVTEDTGIDQACKLAKENCSLAFVEESFQNEATANGSDMKSWYCPNLNRYLECLRQAPCEGEDYSKQVQAEMEQVMQQAGLSCDIDTGAWGSNEDEEDWEEDDEDVEDWEDDDEDMEEGDIDMKIDVGDDMGDDSTEKTGESAGDVSDEDEGDDDDDDDVDESTDDMSVKDMGDDSEEVVDVEEGSIDEDEDDEKDGDDDEEEEDGEEGQEEGGEQAGATLTGERDSAPSTGMSSLPVLVSLVASLALLFRH